MKISFPNFSDSSPLSLKLDLQEISNISIPTPFSNVFSSNNKRWTWKKIILSAAMLGTFVILMIFVETIRKAQHRKWVQELRRPPSVDPNVLNFQRMLSATGSVDGSDDLLFDDQE